MKKRTKNKTKSKPLKRLSKRFNRNELVTISELKSFSYEEIEQLQKRHSYKIAEIIKYGYSGKMKNRVIKPFTQQSRCFDCHGRVKTRDVKILVGANLEYICSTCIGLNRRK